MNAQLNVDMAAFLIHRLQLAGGHLNDIHEVQWGGVFVPKRTASKT